MSRQCNGKGCSSAWDCDNCHQMNCEKLVICDDCGLEMYDEYFSVDDSCLCEDCLLDRYRQQIGE